jgi:hypothetical protein
MQKKTFVNENKLRSKALNTIKLANGEEINRSVIRAELNVITLRNLTKQYQTLYRTICDPENINNQLYKRIIDDDFSVQRFRAGFISNIRRHWLF